jgi:hypothetical protein
LANEDRDRDFDPNKEPSLVREGLTRLLSDRYGFEARKGYVR